MRLKDITEANKKEPIKARDPNWRDMEALRKSGAAGSHGDKTKTIPRKEKYKKISMEDQFQQYMQEANQGSLDQFRNLYKKSIGSDDAAVTLRELIQAINDDALWSDQFPQLKQFTGVSQHSGSRIVTAKKIPGDSADEKITALVQAIDDDKWVDDTAKHLMKSYTLGDDVNEADPDTLGKMNDKMRDVLSKVDADDKAQAQAAKDRAEADRQAKAKELGPQAMDDYIAKLKAHDWTYQYSDDHSVWQRGSKEADEIRRLGDIVDPDRKLYKQYSPFYEAIQEKLGKDDDMGDWIKDFYKSDAPQFKGKSKAKRRQMAIAAKLSAESSDIFKALQQVDETATAGATSAGSIATVVSPHIAIGDKKTRKKYGLTGGLPNPPKAKRIDPKDNALDMKGTSIFGGPLKR